MSLVFSVLLLFDVPGVMMMMMMMTLLVVGALQKQAEQELITVVALFCCCCYSSNVLTMTSCYICILSLLLVVAKPLTRFFRRTSCKFFSSGAALNWLCRTCAPCSRLSSWTSGLVKSAFQEWELWGVGVARG